MPTKTPSKAARKPKPKKPKAAAPKSPKPTPKEEKAPVKKAAAQKSTPATQKPAPVAKAPAGKGASPKAPGTTRARPTPPAYIPRALPLVDDEDDVLGVHGAGHGAGYGRCGGRMLGSALEQSVCDRLGQAGVAHSHSPRHFEVSLQEKQVAAYAPMVVLRGRGREGKSVVIEAVEDAKNPIVSKIVAFRRQYGQEYYVILIGTDEALDEIPLATYDESCAVTDVNTLIARLAE